MAATFFAELRVDVADNREFVVDFRGQPYNFRRNLVHEKAVVQLQADRKTILIRELHHLLKILIIKIMLFYESSVTPPAFGTIQSDYTIVWQVLCHLQIRVWSASGDEKFHAFTTSLFDRLLCRLRYFMCFETY